MAKGADRTSFRTTGIHHELDSISAKELSCGLAKRWTERYIRRGVEPKRWTHALGELRDRAASGIPRFAGLS